MARIIQEILKVVQPAAEDARNGTENFKASFFAPMIVSKERGGIFPKFGRTHQKLQNFKVAPTADSPRVGHDVSSVSYQCEVHRASDILAVEEQEWDDSDLLTAVNIQDNIEEALAIEREKEVADFVVDRTHFTLNGSPDTKFDAPGGEVGVYVANMKLAVLGKINRMPNRMAATPDVALWLQQHVAQCGYGSGKLALPSYADVAAFFQMEAFEIAVAQYDSAKPGKTATPAFLYGDQRLWLFRTPAGPKSPGFLGTPYYPKLSKTRVTPLGGPHVEGYFIEGRFCYDFVTIDETACFCAYDVLST